jgi:predicted transcriptional regulator
MKKRDEYEIVADILTILYSEGPMYRTSIAGKSKLDTRMLERYIRMLLDAKLIERDEYDPKLFTITTNGRRYILLYNSIKTML